MSMPLTRAMFLLGRHAAGLAKPAPPRGPQLLRKPEFGEYIAGFPI
jgi:hypothetical protein